MNMNMTKSSILGAMLTVALPLAGFMTGCGDSSKGASSLRTSSVIIDPVVDPNAGNGGGGGGGIKKGPALVALGTSANFAILSKSGITDVASSVITGDVGASPITGAAILLTCSEVTGTIYSVDVAGPLPCVVTNATLLATAVADMETAYADAAGRITPDFNELGTGEIGGLTLAPGLYKWSTGVSISTDVTIAGGAKDVWIFQVDGVLSEAAAKSVILSGGAQAKNIFWQVAGGAVIGTTANFEGTILSATSITPATSAVVNGRLLAQTAVTLQMNTVTIP